ncbi:MAG: NAD-dependent epimerase/dehydratase family protein [Rhodospirillales bacterium]|nr:NAD-dependent epimerase/dehydratase family protein [Rhodospirillales bacterium]
MTAGHSRYLIVGGAGFIGSHFTDRLLADAGVAAVTLYDNFSSGREWHFQCHLDDPRLKVVRADVKDQDRLTETARRHDLVIHLASNPDIALAANQPAIDFDEGTALTHHVVEAMRISGCRRLLYASGSGIYGDLGELEINEDHGPLVPISTYGASKLAGEAIIAAYCHMFDLSACIFRLGNVVGARQTHGVGFDFIRSLLADASRLDILGDGRQSKSYIHVDDVISAVLQANAGSAVKYNVFNVASGDYITVKEIADLAVECAGLSTERVEYRFSGGERGWKGDVPVVRFDTGRIRKLGWKCRHSSRQALRRSLEALIEDVRAGNR